MQKRMISLFLALLLLTGGTAQAAGITLPSSLKTIEDYAFYNDTSISQVTMPSGMTTIGNYAFKNCENLSVISIPASVGTIGTGAFTGCTADLLIRTVLNSAAQQYAMNNNIDFQANTVYRALLIGQSYENSYDYLSGPPKDVAGMRKALTNFSGTSYKITSYIDLTASQIKSAITSAFKGATSADVSLFFYSGHGVNSENTEYLGALCGVDKGGYVTSRALRQTLDKIPGRKIVIIDACHSGAMIRSKNANEKTGEKTGLDFVNSFNNSFIEAFSYTTAKSSTGLADNPYFVLTTAAASTDSYDSDYGGRFTREFTLALGYDMVQKSYTSMRGDANKNNVITLNEIYQSIKSNSSLWSKQQAQVYPANCNWFGVARK